MICLRLEKISIRGSSSHIYDLSNLPQPKSFSVSSGPDVIPEGPERERERTRKGKEKADLGERECDMICVSFSWRRFQLEMSRV